MDTESKPVQDVATDSIVLEEEIDPNYVPSEGEVVEYAKWLGMDLEKDKDLYWIAREGLMAPLPKDWKPCKTKDTEDVYYFNFTTGESTWDHPCDGYYKKLYEEEKKKKEIVIKESGDQNRSKAKQDVEQLLGKADKKRKKKTVSDLNTIDMVKPLPVPLGVSKKPLPGIVAPLRASGSDISTLTAGRLLPKPGSAPDLRVGSSLELPRTGGPGILQTGIKPLGPLTSNSGAENPTRPHTAPAPSGLNPEPKGNSARVDFGSEFKEGTNWSPPDAKSDSIDSVDAELGKLPITASLKTSSRVLNGPSAGASSRTPVAQDAKEAWTSSVYNQDADFLSKGQAEASAGAEISQAELQRLRDRCAALERQLAERGKEESQLRASNETLRRDLSAIESKYESSQAHWRDKLRTLENENSALDAERRKLKFELLDLQDRAVVAPSSASDGVSLERHRDLQQELLSAQSALSRSAATHAEFQQQSRGAEEGFQLRAAKLEAERAAALAESERLAIALREAQSKVAQPAACPSSEAQRVQHLTQKLSAAEEDLRQARRQLNDEQARCGGLLDQIMAMGEAGEAQARAWQEERGELMTRIEKYMADLSATKAELEVTRTQAAQNIPLLRRAEAAEAQQHVLEGQMAERKTAEASLRREIADLQRRASEDQEQILALQAARSQLAATESERQQFETFSSQATAVRKALKAEIEKLKTQLQDVETEKSTLLTQLTRQETTLQFAKKELNDVATLRETLRQLETEKQLLAAQAEQMKEAVAAHQAEEFQLRERCDRMVVAGAEAEQQQKDLRAENVRLADMLEGERSVVAQQEKKIKSYQEELLQLQRRIADHVVAQSRDGPGGTAPSSPVAFLHSVARDPPSEEGARLSVLQAQLAEKEEQVQAAQQERDGHKLRTLEVEARVQCLSNTVEELRAVVETLQQQLKARTGELADSSKEVAILRAELSSRVSDAHAGEEDARSRASAVVIGLENEKAVLASQIHNLRNQLSSAQLSVQLHTSSVRLAEEAAESYKDKWMVSERELSQHRVQSARAASTSQDEITTLRAQVDELRAINEVNVSRASELRFAKQECSVLRASLQERESQLAAAAAEISALKAGAKNPEPRAEATPSLGPAAPPPVGAIPSSNSVHSIVALSLEMGRQQVNMQRIEEHLRNTERLLLELRIGAAARGARSSDDSLLPSAVRKRTARSSTEGRNRGSFQDLMRGGETPEPDSLLSPRFSRSEGRKSDTVSAESDSSIVPHSRPSAQSDVSKRWIASVIKRHDLHFHDGATLGTAGAEYTFAGARALAQRVLLEAKTRLKGETKLLREVQTQCAAAKRNLIREQEAVKNLKSLWRSSKDRGGSSRSSALTSESINAVTTLLNDAVDDLREAQLFLRTVEYNAKSLSQTLQYLGEVVSVAEQEVSSPQREAELTARLLDVSRSLQRKCFDSANAMAAMALPSAHDQADTKRTVSWATEAHRASPRRYPRTIRDKHGGAAASRTIPAPFDGVQPIHAAKNVAAAPVASVTLAISSSAAQSKPPSLHSIRSTDMKARLLQNQIDAISQRQSVSKDICEKHAGWLDTLQREINGASHGHSAAASAAWKENAGPYRGSAGKSVEDLAKPAATVVDYALGYEAKAHYSNSRRVFGDTLGNRKDEQKENAPFLTV